LDGKSSHFLRRNLKHSFLFRAFKYSEVTDSYAESYQLRCEFYHDDGKRKWVRGLVSRVVSGVPVILKQNSQIISFLFIIEPPPSNKYSLSLTVSNVADPKSVTDIGVAVLTHTIQSTFVGGKNAPLEFEKEQNGIRIGSII